MAGGHFSALCSVAIHLILSLICHANYLLCGSASLTSNCFINPSIVPFGALCHLSSFGALLCRSVARCAFAHNYGAIGHLTCGDGERTSIRDPFGAVPSLLISLALISAEWHLSLHLGMHLHFHCSSIYNERLACLRKQPDCIVPELPSRHWS